MRSMDSIVAYVLATALAQSGYWPYSNAPAISYTSPVYSPASGLASGIDYTITATITDMDEYQRSVPPNDFKTFGNPNTDITRTINSGSVLSVSTSFDATIGKRTIVWACRAITVPTDLVYTRVDQFNYLDTGAGVVWDGTIPSQFVTVTIAGPKSPGGGGAG